MWRAAVVTRSFRLGQTTRSVFSSVDVTQGLTSIGSDPKRLHNHHLHLLSQIWGQDAMGWPSNAMGRGMTLCVVPWPHGPMSHRPRSHRRINQRN